MATKYADRVPNNTTAGACVRQRTEIRARDALELHRRLQIVPGSRHGPRLTI
jgi:hypothetical protein